MLSDYNEIWFPWAVIQPLGKTSSSSFLEGSREILVTYEELWVHYFRVLEIKEENNSVSIRTLCVSWGCLVNSQEGAIKD